MSEYTIEVRTWYRDGEYHGRNAEWCDPDSLNPMAREILDAATGEYAEKQAAFQMPGTVCYPFKLSDWKMT